MLFAIGFLLTVLFFVPIYRLSKSKGFPARTIVSGVIAYTVTLYGVLSIASIAGLAHWLMGAAWVPVSLVLLVLQLLPKRPGAPGRAWFTIETSCPHCGAALAFDRSREGLMETCNACGEILRVPRQNDSSASPGASGTPHWAVEATSPVADFSHAEPSESTWVVVRGYDLQALAEMNRTRLEEAGITACVRSRAPSAMHPTSLGCDLLVPVADAEHANHVLDTGSRHDDAT